MMVTVREARLADVPTLALFQSRMAAETEQLELDPGTLKRGIEFLFNHPTSGTYYVAETETGVVGCLMTTYEWSDWRCGRVLWIQSVYVLPAYRGQGVYRHMYAHIRARVEADADLKGIRLYVDSRNRGAQAVYARLGMNGDHYKVFEWMKI